VEFFKEPNIDWLRKKWFFLGFSLIFSVAGLVSMFHHAGSWKAWNGLPWGVDFRGGTLVYVKFADTPNPDQIRAAMDKAGLHNARIQRYGAPSNNEVLVALEQKETSEEALDRGKNAIIGALEKDRPDGKQDLNNTGAQSLEEYLLQRDPLRAGTDAPARYHQTAQAIADLRDKTQRGVLKSFDDLKGVVGPEVISALQADYFLSGFAVRNVEIVGPQVGEQLRTQALLATIYASMGMLVYLWFRFELIYGVAAVVAVIHDTLITLGAFSLTRQEISLTVIAAILTLIGYSMNDTIVVFDRIRENLKLMRRESSGSIVNRSINQTLSRTILTSGLTFLTVACLFAFGGEVLHGFSLALVIGILIGTYSSIAVAAPMLVAYQDWRAGQKGLRPATVPVAGNGRGEKRA
jgi:preprotein translocase subunit SecF